MYQIKLWESGSNVYIGSIRDGIEELRLSEATGLAANINALLAEMRHFGILARVVHATLEAEEGIEEAATTA